MSPRNFTVVCDAAARRLTVTVIGALDADAAAAFVNDLARDGRWHYAVLYDVRRMTTSPEEDEMMLIAGRVETLSREGPRGPLALVGLTIPSQVARMMTYADRLRGSGFKLELFDDIESAERWLDQQTR